MPKSQATPQAGLDSVLVGRHAVITGGSRGIGAATARALANLGADVTILARDPDQLTATASRLRDETGAEVNSIAVDVTDTDTLTAALRRCADNAGPISVLINNAGGTKSAPIGALDDANWATTMDLNLTSAFVAIRTVLPGMLECEFGRIVNIASTAGLRGYAYVAAYCAAKHGLIGLTRALAVELAQSPVTVNAVCPGFTDTDMSRTTVDKISKATGRSPDDARKALTDFNPQGRLITPEEVATSVAFLCGPAAVSITGVSLPVAGGEVM